MSLSGKCRASIACLALTQCTLVSVAQTQSVIQFLGAESIDESIHSPRGADPEMAVGPGRVVLVYNSSIVILDKAGSRLLEMPFAAIAGAGTYIDPEVVYDAHAGESGDYFVMFMELGTNDLHIISLGPEPESVSSWQDYTFDGIPSFRMMNIDQPNLTVQDDVLLIWSVEAPLGPVQTHALIVDKHAISSHASNPAHVVVDSEAPGHVISLRVGPSSMESGGDHLVSAYNLHTGGNASNVLALRGMVSPFTVFGANPGNHFSLVTNVSVPTESPAESITTTNGGSLFAPMHFKSAVEHQDGTLWIVQTVNAGPNRSRLRWYQIDLKGWPLDANPEPCLLRTGLIDPPEAVLAQDPSASSLLASIDVNKYGVALVSYHVTGQSTPVSLYTSSRLPSSADFSEGELRLPGALPTTGAHSDYCRVDVDPENQRVFWVHHAMPGSGPDRELPGRSTWVVALAPIYCPADLTGSSDPQSTEFGVPDGNVDTEDWYYFLAAYSNNNLDVDMSGPQAGVPDFTLTQDDLDYFGAVFSDPCDAAIDASCP